jgi:hypothetical protein
VPTAEPIYTAEEVAERLKLHPSTIRRFFMNEPGVIRFGTPGARHRRPRLVLRIPESVLERVLRQRTVKS